MSQLSDVIKFLAAKRMKEDRERGKSGAGERAGGGGGNMRSKMPLNTKAERGFVIGESFRGSVSFQNGGWERRPAGSGMETRSLARLSLCWMEASCDASDAAGHGRRDAFTAVGSLSSEQF